MNDVLSQLHELLMNPVVWKVLVAYWVFSAFVGALPTPTDKSPAIYRFFFRFAHGLSGNLNRAALSFKIPGASDDK